MNGVMNQVINVTAGTPGVEALAWGVLLLVAAAAVAVIIVVEVKLKNYNSTKKVTLSPEELEEMANPVNSSSQ